MSLTNLAFELWIRTARLLNRKRQNAFFVVLLGGPGAGKGTVASKLAPALQVPTLDFGRLIRKEMKEQTAFGRKWKPEVDAGRLIPDAAILDLVLNELGKAEYQNGAIIDGMRTPAQAKAFRKRLACWGNRMNIAIFLDVPEADLVERLSLRRTCSNTSCKSESYHIKFRAPKVDGKCDLCGSELIERDDQKPEAVRTRFAEFHRTFAPLRAYFDSMGVLRTVVSTNRIGADQVYAGVLAAIKGLD